MTALLICLVLGALMTSRPALLFVLGLPWSAIALKRRWRLWFLVWRTGHWRLYRSAGRRVLARRAAA